MSLNGIRLVTFDATNTLLKFRIAPWEYYTQVARGYGFKGTEQQVHQRFYENYKLIWKYYPNFGCETIGWRAWWQHVIKRTFREHFELCGSIDKLSDQLVEDFKTSKCWKQADSASDLIKDLRERNISVGIISNFDPRLHNVLDEVGFDKKDFEFVFTSYAAKLMKPDPKIFDSALKSCGKFDVIGDLRDEIRAQEALHVGDDYENDYCAAKYAGWKSALILNDKSLEGKVDYGEAFKSIADLRDFLMAGNIPNVYKLSKLKELPQKESETKKLKPMASFAPREISQRCIEANKGTGDELKPKMLADPVTGDIPKNQEINEAVDTETDQYKKNTRMGQTPQDSGNNTFNNPVKFEENTVDMKAEDAANSMPPPVNMAKKKKDQVEIWIENKPDNPLPQYSNQGQPLQQGYTYPGYPNQGYGYPEHPNQGYTHQGYTRQGYPNQGYPNQGYPNQQDQFTKPGTDPNAKNK